MKRNFIAVVLIMFLLSVSALLQADEISAKEEKGWTPIRFTLWPRLIGIPWNTNVYGLNIGIATDIDEGCELEGVDLSALGSTTNNATGVLMSIAQTTYNSKILQLCLGGVMQRSEGVQLGIIVSLARGCKSIVQPFALVNRVRECDSAFQLGIYNVSSDSKGFQIGLMNYMDDGFFPMFPFFNFSLSETHKDSQSPYNQ